MLKLMTLSFALVCGTAVADDTVMICHKEGYTADSADFHQIPVNNKRVAFTFDQKEATVDGERYIAGDAKLVGLETLATTYYSQDFNKVLYLYVNEDGDREVGISAIEPDTDTVFRDKAVYQDCGFEGGGINVSTAQVLRTNSNTGNAAGAIYVF